MSSIITLLSDFGYQDVYVGVMKGVMLTINPQLTLVDLSHGIPPQDIVSGSFQLGNAYPYFPEGTIYLAVVDPGVGSQRQGVAIQTSGGYLVGPNNGLFTHILSQTSPLTTVTLTNPAFWRTPQPSATFHGRDIFAAAAAYLASGVPILKLGPPLPAEALVRYPLPSYQPIPNGWRGVIQAIDTYGNLITNLPAELITSPHWQVVISGQTLIGQTTYSNSQPGTLVALIGSHGWLEIALTHGNAQQRLDLQMGDPVQLELKPF
jgi:S-adenosyl-L-methionine hydrolase (adenosine-forming)